MEPDLPLDLDRIAQDAESELGARGRLFSPDGFVRLNTRISDYIGELTTESARVARRHQADSISPSYVDRAAEHLASGKPAMWRRALGGIGGLIFGVGLAVAGSMIQANSFSTRGFVLAIICILVGMPPFLIHISKE